MHIIIYIRLGFVYYTDLLLSLMGICMYCYKIIQHNRRSSCTRARVLMAVRCSPAQDDERQWYSELKLSSFDPLEYVSIYIKVMLKLYEISNALIDYAIRTC